MTKMTLPLAQDILAAALAHARAKHYAPMGVVVVDAAGQTVVCAREDGASALRLDIALGKAGAAIGMGVNSRALALRAKDLPAFFNAVASTAAQKFIAQTGAVLVRNADGTVIGAAGASGGTGDEDEALCAAGVVAVGLRAE